MLQCFFPVDCGKRELLACCLSDKDGVTGLYRLVAFEMNKPDVASDILYNLKGIIG